MSLHAQLSTEAKARLHAQQRNSTITSLVISFLVVVLVGLVLLFILLPVTDNYTPEIVSYQSGVEEDKKVEKRKINRSVEKKPSSPSSSMAKVIASNSVSNIAIPVPDNLVSIDSVDYGSGSDFGSGWGEEDWGSGSGTSFFGQTVAGERILYIIDYSLSMAGKKDELMRAELADSVMKLPAGKQFQLIFFAGPAWVAGDELGKGRENVEVKTAGGKKVQWAGKGAMDFKCKDDLPQPKWLDATDSVVKKSLKIIEEEKLVWGTDWSNPLEMAFTMDPLPQVIIFMTDGHAGKKSLPTAEKYSKLAKEKGVLINTIALMEPKAATDMASLAKPTGGAFSLINENGEKEEYKQIKKKDKKK
ncbi:MAG: hypothetical protein KJO21_09410 [Verrucomicrobiae bacterium]|nr:hypothetical protein [Verrucomicrobiae bacterium]NNJ42357.1 VWA domain-containing protein [Akkermansiaceae bacterium]